MMGWETDLKMTLAELCQFLQKRLTVISFLVPPHVTTQAGPLQTTTSFKSSYQCLFMVRTHQRCISKNNALTQSGHPSYQISVLEILDTVFQVVPLCDHSAVPISLRSLQCIHNPFSTLSSLMEKHILMFPHMETRLGKHMPVYVIFLLRRMQIILKNKHSFIFIMIFSACSFLPHASIDCSLEGRHCSAMW